MQVIEIWSERRDTQGTLLGLEHETVFYDPGTFVEPVRDLYDRPWARVWEQFFEQNMSKPEEDDSLGGFR